MNEITAYSENVKTRTVRIKTIQGNVCRELIEIGNELIEIKNELGHGQWESYLKNQLGYTGKTANNLMRVAIEFGDSNLKLISDLQSTKIFELLSIPQDYREDFIQKSNIEDSTVRELKVEIQKYKEENGLLTAKQKKALEEKRRAEQEKLRIQQELQREKSKQPEVVYRTDQKDIDRLRLLETVNKELSTKTLNLEKSLSMNKQLLENYKTDSEEYRKLKLQMSKLQVEMDSVAQKQVSVLKLTELASEIEFFLHSKLAPTKYKDFMSVLNNDDAVRCNFIHTIEIVGDWYREMKTYINENNYENIITVEVN